MNDFRLAGIGPGKRTSQMLNFT